MLVPGGPWDTKLGRWATTGPSSRTDRGAGTGTMAGTLGRWELARRKLWAGGALMLPWCPDAVAQAWRACRVLCSQQMHAHEHEGGMACLDMPDT